MTDFTTWDRKTLEQFARQAADENRELHADLRAALDAYRALVRAQALPAGPVPLCIDMLPTTAEEGLPS